MGTKAMPSLARWGAVLAIAAFVIWQIVGNVGADQPVPIPKHPALQTTSGPNLVDDSVVEHANQLIEGANGVRVQLLSYRTLTDGPCLDAEIISDTDFGGVGVCDPSVADGSASLAKKWVTGTTLVDGRTFAIVFGWHAIDNIDTVEVNWGGDLRPIAVEVADDGTWVQARIVGDGEPERPAEIAALRDGNLVTMIGIPPAVDESEEVPERNP